MASLVALCSALYLSRKYSYSSGNETEMNRKQIWPVSSVHINTQGAKWSAVQWIAIYLRERAGLYEQQVCKRFVWKNKKSFLWLVSSTCLTQTTKHHTILSEFMRASASGTKAVVRALYRSVATFQPTNPAEWVCLQDYCNEQTPNSNAFVPNHMTPSTEHLVSLQPV